MREMTPEMRTEAAYYLGAVDVTPAWQAMIDAALKNEAKRGEYNVKED
jgi:hypothetical protein